MPESSTFRLSGERGSLRHYTSLDFRGQRITQDIELSNAEKVENLPELLIIAMRWGDAQGMYNAEELVAEMVDNDRAHLIRRLPELHRWLRADGRSAEQIAADWNAQQQRYQAEEAAGSRVSVSCAGSNSYSSTSKKPGLGRASCLHRFLRGNPAILLDDLARCTHLERPSFSIET